MEREESLPGIEKCSKERGETRFTPLHMHSWMEPAESPLLAGPDLSLAAEIRRILVPALEWDWRKGLWEWIGRRPCFGL